MGDRGEEQPGARAHEDQRRDERAVGDPRCGPGGEPGRPGRDQRRAEDHRRARAEPVGQRAAHRGEQHRHGGHRQQAQAGVERCGAEPDLDQVGDEEQPPEQRGVEEQRDGVGGGEGPAPEQAQRQQVEPGPRPPALGEARPGERHQRQPEGHVDPEDRPPAGQRGERAAEQGSQRRAETADPAPGTERPPAAFGRRRHGEQGHRERNEDRRACALHRPRGHECADVGGQRGGGRARGEGRDADGEHPPAPEAVAEGGPADQEQGERERVGVDRPLRADEVRTEIAPDRRQGGGDGQPVEREEEPGRGRDGEGPGETG